jgi:hypothetical protein
LRPTAGHRAPNSTAVSTGRARPFPEVCASSTARANRKLRSVCRTPFLPPETDKVLKSPDCSRLALWDLIRERWLGFTTPVPVRPLCRVFFSWLDCLRRAILRGITVGKRLQPLCEMTS